MSASYDTLISDLEKAGASTVNASSDSHNSSNSYDQVIKDLSSSSEAVTDGEQKQKKYSDMTRDEKEADLAEHDPWNEAGAAILSGLASKFTGGVKGLATLAAGAVEKQPLNKTMKDVKDVIEKESADYTYQPRGAAGKSMMEALASDYNPLNWPGLLVEKASTTSAHGATSLGSSPNTSASIGTGVGLAGDAATALLPWKLAKNASKISPEIKAANIAETPTGNALKQAITSAGEDIHPIAAQRHAEAASLPVKVELTAGQATGDINLLSRELNMRGQRPALAERFNAQNKQLIDNLNAIRESSAPDVTAVNHVENGQTLIDAYKAKDEILSKNINAKYKALEDANGGNFPVDSKAFVKTADDMLAKKMKGRYVPPEIAADLNEFREGGTMTYENFENMRTNLAAEARKAERSGDGNRAMATSIVRDALESLPMTGESSIIKPLADSARSAARERFELMKNDPAYKAAVNDSTAADDFINKFIVNGKVEHVKAMRDNLADNKIAGQTIAAGTLNYLKARAGLTGINGDIGNFSQAGYNKALTAISPKLDMLLPEDAAKQVQTLNNVARYTQEQPRGSYVNNSNTFTGYAAEKAKSAAEGVANVAAGGVPVGTWVRKGLEKRALNKWEQKSLEPNAGTKLSDLLKK